MISSLVLSRGKYVGDSDGVGGGGGHRRWPSGLHNHDLWQNQDPLVYKLRYRTGTQWYKGREIECW